MRLGWIAIVAAVACGCSSSTTAPRSGAIKNTWNAMWGHTAVKSVKKMEDPNSPDNRRQGIYELVATDFGQSETYCKRYRQIAQDDPDFTVRAAAVRACNWARDKNAVPIFIAALNDKSDMVRWEAAKGLGNIPGPDAVAPLIRTMNNADEMKNVKIAAADALRHYKDLNVARTLVATFGGKDFSIAWQARQSLRSMTGTDLQYSERAWLEYLTSDKRPLG